VASLRKLRRRALAWRRYEHRAYGPHALPVHEGAKRAMRRVDAEQYRRNPYHGYGPCYCVGCIGSGRCEHDDPDDFDDSVCECPWCVPDDEAGHGDDWPPTVTETAFADRGLL